jgi:hypothetical protein
MTRLRSKRKKLYHIRDEIRAEARAKTPVEPRMTFDSRGRFAGVIDVVASPLSPLTPYEGLRFRVYAGAVWILPITYREPKPRRVDQHARQLGSEVSRRDLTELPPWPPHSPW